MADPPPGPISVLVLAAGLGIRMNSRRAKVLHELCGEPMIAHTLRAVRSVEPNTITIVVGYQADEVRQAVQAAIPDAESSGPAKPVAGGENHPAIRFAVQSEQRGTGHAVMCAREELARITGDLLLIYGDVPLIERETLQSLIDTHRKERAAMSVITTRLANPEGYGRIVRDRGRRLARIVEEKDCGPRERRVTEINTGIYAFRVGDLLGALDRLSNANAQGEFYLTDVAGLLRRRGKKIATLRMESAERLLGINTRQELAGAGARMRARVLDRLMSAGVTIIDPATTYIDARARLGQDTVVHPQVIIEGPSSVGAECIIESWTHIAHSRLGDRVRIRNGCLIADCRLGDDTTVGPFAHLRMDSELERGATVGNFVEMKKSKLGQRSKTMHLTYLGDATIGERVNIGAGTVTCNYDGRRKNPTFIEDDVRIGSDTMLVAPVRVGKGAVTGAGSVVTKDVPPGTLVVGVPATVKKKVE